MKKGGGTCRLSRLLIITPKDALFMASCKCKKTGSCWSTLK